MWTQAYATSSNDDELGDLKANVKTAGARLAGLRSERDRLQAEIDQGSVSQARQRDLLEGVQLWREEILNADDEARRFIIERLRVHGRLRHDETGLWVDIRLMLDDDAESSRLATKTLRSIEYKGTGKKPVSLSSPYYLGQQRRVIEHSLLDTYDSAKAVNMSSAPFIISARLKL